MYDQLLSNLAFNCNLRHYMEAAKSWAGHTEPAAGALGLTTLMWQLSHQTLQGQAHLRSINPHVSEAMAKTGGAVMAGPGKDTGYLFPRHPSSSAFLCLDLHGIL